MAFPVHPFHDDNMHVCLFDIDGTLIASGGAGKAALEAALASEFGIDNPIDKLLLSGRTDRAIVRDLFQQHGLADSDANRQLLFAGYLRHLPACLADCPGRVLPGVAALLQQLRAEGRVAVGLLTGNVRAGARVKLGHFGLDHYFEFGGFGDLHHDRDDVAREAFAVIGQRFNGAVVRERIWVIGDTPLDIRCGRSIGARVVAVATGWHTPAELATHQPDVLLPDLADAAPLLQYWR